MPQNDNGNGSSNERARKVIEGGLGTSPKHLERAMRGLSAASGERAAILLATVGKDAEGLADGVEDIDQRQAARPHLYIKKRWLRPRSKRRKPPTNNDKDWFRPQPPTRHITVDEFIDMYSAVAFANRCGIVLNCHLTIHWRSLGWQDHGEIAHAFGEFTRRFREWARVSRPEKEKFPAVWIYSHENSPEAGLHTHVLLFVTRKHQKAFRSWARRSFVRSSRVRPLPSEAIDIKIRAPRTTDSSARRARCIWAQWMWFHYLCKGMKPATRLGTMRRGPDKVEQIYLDDLLMFEPQDPGAVTCRNRVGTSQNLAAAQRRIGFINEKIPSRAPNFRSALERNKWDVRELFSAVEYNAFRSQVSALLPRDGPSLEEIESMGLMESPRKSSKRSTKPHSKSSSSSTKAVSKRGKRILVPGRQRRVQIEGGPTGEES